MDKKTISSAIKWLSTARIAGQVISWALTILVMRILDPGDYGLAAMGVTFISLISLVSEFGFGAAIIQTKEISDEQISSVFGASLLFSIGCYLFLVAIAPLGSNFYNDERITGILALSGSIFVINALATVPDALLRRDMNFKAISIIDFFSTLIGGLITYTLASKGFGYWSLIVSPIAAALTKTIALQIHCTKRYLPSLKISEAISLIRFGSQVAISRMGGYIVNQSDIILAGRYLGKEGLGIYSVAVDLAMMPLNKIMSLATQIALPALSQANRNDPSNRNNLMYRPLAHLGHVIFSPLWGIAAISPWLIPELIGEKWHDAIIPTQIIAILLPLRAINIYLNTASTSFGHPEIDLKDKIYSAMIYPPLFYIGCHYGPLGLAASWYIALPATTYFNLKRLKNTINASPIQIITPLIRPLICCVLMGITVSYIGHNLAPNLTGWKLLATLIFSGLISYLVAIFIFDQKLLFSNFKKMKNKNSHSTNHDL